MTEASYAVAEGKTATIVSASQLAINVGADDGVQDGDLITVRRSVKVTDPDSRKELGVVHLTRLRLRVTMLSDTFAVGTVIDQTPSNPLGAFLDVTRVNRYKTIVGYESQASESSVFISPGEPVIVTRQIDEDEEGL